MTYQELAHRIADNDCEIAFGIFYRKYRYWIYRSAIKMLHCHFDTEEAVNSVFAHLWQVRKRYDATKGAWLTWVGIVTERFLWNEYRKQQRAKAKRIGNLLSETDPDRDELAAIADPYPVAHIDAIVISEQMLILENALCDLTCIEARLAWVLRFVEGYPYAAIAKVIRQSQVVTQNRVKKATRHIKAYMTDD